MLPECAAYLERIDNLRNQIVGLIAGQSAKALNWRPIEGRDDHATNSLAVMATHVAGAEHFWMHEVVGRGPATRVREAEFQTAVDSPASLVKKLEDAAAETRTVLSSLTTDDLDSSRHVHERTVPVRWAILHVLDHTALHLGHMQLTLQLWQGGQAGDSPRWFQRFND